MAEGIELGDVGSARDEDVDGPAVQSERPNFLGISASEAAEIRKLENEPVNFTDISIEAQRRELTKTKKVDAFLKAVADRYGLLPGKHMHIYDEFVLGENKRDLYLKDGLTRVNYKRDSTKYLVLPSIGGAEFIRTRLFPKYTTTIRPTPTRQQVAALTAAASQMTGALQRIETVRLQDLPQRASNVDIAIQTLVAQQETSFGGLPEREILGLNEALKRTRGALVDNLAKL